MNRISGFVLAAVVSTAAAAQGSFDFSRVEALPAEPSVQIDLPAAMLGFVTEAARTSDPATAKALEGIRGVRVLVYEDLDAHAPMLDTLEETSRMLEDEGWQRMVYVNEDEERVRMYVKLGGESLAGMTVMVVSSNEAVFLNVDGSIEPATLGQLASAFGMGGMLDDMTGLGASLPDAAAAGGADAPTAVDAPTAADAPADADAAD